MKIYIPQVELNGKLPIFNIYYTIKKVKLDNLTNTVNTFYIIHEYKMGKGFWDLKK